VVMVQAPRKAEEDEVVPAEGAEGEGAEAAAGEAASNESAE